MDTADKPLTVPVYRDRFTNHADTVKQYMEYHFELVDLLPIKVFTAEQMDKLNSNKESEMERNKTVLQMLCELDVSEKETEVKYNNFFAALERSLQSHLKHLIHVDNNFSREDANQPLKADQRDHLLDNQYDLVEILSTEYDGILDKMSSKKCISVRHSRSVTEKDGSYKKARELLNIVRNRSLDHFRKFRLCLSESKSTAFALTEVEKTGATPSVDSVQEPDGDKKTAEKTVAKKHAEEATSSASASETGNCPIALKDGNSIRAFYHCKDLASIAKLRQDVKDGVIKSSLQALYDRLLGGDKRTVSLTVKRVFLVKFAIYEFRLQCAKENANASDVMCDHPLLRNGKDKMDMVLKSVSILKEVKERIVLKAILWRATNGRKLFARPDVEAMETIGSVCRDWYKITQGDSFKRTFRKSSDELRKNYESIKLKCETRITMDQEIICVGSLLDESYIVTRECPNCLYMYDPNKSAMQSATSTESTEPVAGEETIEGISLEERKRIEAAVVQSVIEESKLGEERMQPPTHPAQKSKKEVVDVKQANLEKIEIADGIDISSVESVDDQTSLFCISRTDNSVWFWTRSETRNKATALKQFSPCTNITISPQSKGNLRIVVLKDRNAVEMHNPSSELIQMMFLPNHVVKVNDILCNKEGQMIVCYGSDDNPLHRVTRLNRLGKPILSYGNERGDGVNELNNPCSITIDQDEDILYVVDKGNERIVALDKNMNLMNVILDGRNNPLGSPRAVRLTKGVKRLHVVYENVVEIYKVIRKYGKHPGALPIVPVAAAQPTGQ